MTKKRILISVGTRPEIIKMAPVYLELKKAGAEPLLLHTGQHNGMTKHLYKFFGIMPDYNIDLVREKADGLDALSALSIALMRNISIILSEADPDIVLVHGDTSSAMISALAAFYQQRQIGHVEAGLRSHDSNNPFPEEKNRVLIAQLANFHFSPTIAAKKNLLREGVDPKLINVVGNTIVEASELGVEKLEGYDCGNTTTPELICDLQPELENKKMILVTAHRRENQDGNIGAIAEAVCELLTKHENIFVVWPVHPNPKVMQEVQGVIDKAPKKIKARIHLTAPLDYPVLLWVLKNSWLVMTDSGGIQEEAIGLRVPVLVLRDNTERQEIIKAGAGILVGTRKKKIIAQVRKLLRRRKLYEAMRKAKNPYGDGTASECISDILTGRPLKMKHPMKRPQKKRSAKAAVILLLFASIFSFSAKAEDAQPYKTSGYVETGGDYHSISNNYGDWYGEYVKGQIQTDPDNIWNGEFTNQTEFHENGQYGAIGDTHIFNPKWFGSATLGVGNDASYMPRYRADVFLNRKLLDREQLIATVGLGDYKSMDVHEDRSLFLGATYYFQDPWIIQAGIRGNNSSPGDVNSTSQFIAVTQGKDKDYFLTLRYGFGTEAYQIIGPNTALSDFHSDQLSLEWRKWVSKRWGFDVRGEDYHNPNYDRLGVNFGVFREF